MTTNLTETEILKTDVLGRVRMPPQRREAILDEFEKSGLAGAPFAKLIGVNYQTLMSWVQKRRKAHGSYRPPPGSTEARAVKFVEAVVAATPAEQVGLTIQLPGGAWVRVAGPEQMDLMCRFLARLVKTELRGC